jgi:putrescine aminotransferase
VDPENRVTPSRSLIPLREVGALGKDRTLELYTRHINSVFGQSAGPFGLIRNYTRAEGIFLWDDSGRKYFDFFNSFGCLNLGHNHPAVVGAVQQALNASVPMIHQLSPSPFASALAYNLSTLLPEQLSVSYFMNSGSEAVEAAIKLARIATGRKRLLAAQNSYHGRTLGALTLTGMEQYRKPFEPLLAHVELLPWDDTAAMEKALRPGDVAALFLEPIQGQGGVRVPGAEYLRTARKLCDKHGALLVLDEVQTGFGRTGAMFAFEHSGICPDVLLTSKSLGGGLMPLSACTTTSRIWGRAYGSLKKFVLHSSTFSGNTLACVAGLAAIETIVNERLVEKAAESGAYFFSRLNALAKKHPVIKEIRGRGLMIGIVFDLSDGTAFGSMSRTAIEAISPKIVTAWLASRLLSEYAILVPPSLTEEHFLRIYPPLGVSPEHIDYFVDSLDHLCGSLGGYQKILREVTPLLARYGMNKRSAAV